MNVLNKSYILLLVFTICSCGKNVKDCDISYYYNVLYKEYAEVIVSNANNDLSQYHGDLGTEDTELTALLIRKEKSSFLLAVLQYDEKKPIIHLRPILLPDTTFIYTYTKRYDCPLDIYEKPYTSHITATIKEYFSDPIKVIDVNGTWLKVSIEINGYNYEGWIPQEEYCSNPYTTCS